MSVSSQCHLDPVSAVFDQIAETYDDVFTRSVIGRAQRGAVWEVLAQTFRSGDHVLELNCGTGEDALFLGRNGVSVVACDAAGQMVEVARKRKGMEGARLPVEFQTHRTEDIKSLRATLLFDGILSNFSGLNCVEDLHGVASDVAPKLKQGANIVVCLSSRTCAWEIVWFSLRLNFAKASRRLRGSTVGHIGELAVRLWYPTIRQTRRAFAPWFRLQSIRAVGLCVPPTYLEYWAARYPKVVERLTSLDRAFAKLPIFRGLGDHVLLRFEKVSS